MHSPQDRERTAVQQELEAAKRFEPVFSDVQPLASQAQILQAMDRWAEQAAAEGLPSLLQQRPDFLPFWLGVKERLDLASLFLGQVKGLQVFRDELRHQADVAPLAAAHEQMAEAERHQVRRLAATARNVTDPDRAFALGSLCQFVLSSSDLALRELRDIMKNEANLVLLEQVATEPGPDQWAATAALARLTSPSESFSVAALRALGTRAWGVGQVGGTVSQAVAARAQQLYADVLRELGQHLAWAQPAAVESVAGTAGGEHGTEEMVLGQEQVQGSARLQISTGDELYLRLRVDGLREWQDQRLWMVIPQPGPLWELQQQGIRWKWLTPGVFVSDRPVDDRGRVVIQLGSSTSRTIRDHERAWYEAMKAVLEGGEIEMGVFASNDAPHVPAA